MAPHVLEQPRGHWPALLRHEDKLRSRLAELGLLLEVNRDRGYAFTRQASDHLPLVADLTLERDTSRRSHA